MNVTPDYLIERKRTKIQLYRWKLIVLLLLILLLFAWAKAIAPIKIFNAGSADKGPYIAGILIDEPITEDIFRMRKLNEIADDDNIKALIVNINSPGGSVVGSEMLYNALLKISAKKPVVTIMDSVATSGAYLAALGSDYIICHNGTITGSIGVIMQSAEITELSERLGVKFNNFKSSPLKATPNFSEKVTPEVQAAIMENIIDIHDYFIQLVALRRHLDLEYVKKIADGRIYSGRQALKFKLVDAIGNEDTALAWLHLERKIAEDIKVIDIKLRKKEGWIGKMIDDIDVKISGFFINKFYGLKSIM